MNWIMALYKEAMASILFNEVSSPIFMLERLVRQGCPLAPYPYFFIVDVLIYMLDDVKHNIVGFSLLDGTHTTSQMLANDTNLLLKGTKDNLNAANEGT